MPDGDFSLPQNDPGSAGWTSDVQSGYNASNAEPGNVFGLGFTPTKHIEGANQPPTVHTSDTKTQISARDVLRQIGNAFKSVGYGVKKAWGKITQRNELPRELANGAKLTATLSRKNIFGQQLIGRGTDSYSGKLNKKGLAHGVGSYEFTDSHGKVKTFVGRFENGKIVGQAALYEKDGVLASEVSDQAEVGDEVDAEVGEEVKEEEEIVYENGIPIGGIITPGKKLPDGDPELATPVNASDAPIDYSDGNDDSPQFTFDFSVGGTGNGGTIPPDPIEEKSKEPATSSHTPNEATETEPFKFSNGGVYVGRLENNQPNGWGKSTSVRGTVFEGEFRNGALNGYGKMTTVNGISYEGEFRNNQFHGKGTLVSTGALKTVIQEGDFAEGRFLGGTTSQSKSFEVAQNNLYGSKLKEKLEAKNARFEKAKADVENKTKNS